MKDEDIKNIRERMNKLMDDDLEKPLWPLFSQISNNIFHAIKYTNDNILKNLDVIIDLLKVFLSVSGTILIASYSIPSFNVNKISLISLVVTLIIMLVIFLLIRTYATARANKSFVDSMKNENIRLMNTITSYVERKEKYINHIEKSLDFLSKPKDKKRKSTKKH